MMRITTAVLFTMLATAATGFAQPPAVDSDYQVGGSAFDQGREVESDAAGNSYLLFSTSGPGFPGATNLGGGGFDYVLEKWDSTATPLFSVQFGTSTTDILGDLAVIPSGTNQGRSLVTGQTWGGVFPGETGFGSIDAFAVFHNPDGTVLDIDQFGIFSQTIGQAAHADENGFYLAGYTGGVLPDTIDAFLRIYDSDGTPLDTVLFGTPAQDTPWGLTTDSLGNIYVVGNTLGAFTGFANAGSADAFIAKFAPDGTLLAVNQQGSSGSDAFTGAGFDGSDNLVVAGWATGDFAGLTQVGQRDVVMQGLDSSTLAVLWSRLDGGLQIDTAESLVVDPTGNVSLAGRTDGGMTSLGLPAVSFPDGIVITRDVFGNFLWADQYGAGNFFTNFGIDRSPDGRTWVIGETTGAFAGPSGGSSDVALRVYEPFIDPRNLIDECTVIDTPGNYFIEQTLSVDSDTCIEIIADDVTLDGQGQTIELSGTMPVGVSISGVSNVEIFDLNIEVVGTTDMTALAVINANFIIITNMIVDFALGEGNCVFLDARDSTDAEIRGSHYSPCLNGFNQTIIRQITGLFRFQDTTIEGTENDEVDFDEVEQFEAEDSLVDAPFSFSDGSDLTFNRTVMTKRVLIERTLRATIEESILGKSELTDVDETAMDSTDFASDTNPVLEWRGSRARRIVAEGITVTSGDSSSSRLAAAILDLADAASTAELNGSAFTTSDKEGVAFKKMGASTLSMTAPFFGKPPGGSPKNVFENEGSTDATLTDPTISLGLPGSGNSLTVSTVGDVTVGPGEGFGEGFVAGFPFPFAWDFLPSFFGNGSPATFTVESDEVPSPLDLVLDLLINGVSAAVNSQGQADGFWQATVSAASEGSHLVTAPATCGNGIREAWEECDDTNTQSGDGCSENCTLEPTCGDGNLDPGEECDDGNDVDGDGCSADCTAESICGNGSADEGEQCDQTDFRGFTCEDAGFDRGTLACNADCTFDFSGCSSCGDGKVDPGEACDDGNSDLLDGCDSNCQIEEGWECDGQSPSTCSEFCGDSLVVGSEHCDETNLQGATCVDLGFERGTLACSPDCEFDFSGCSTCGDGKVETGEECDDGNDLGGDGCAEDCTLEPVCGNGIQERGEACDDGDNSDCDGCSTDCFEEFCGDGKTCPNEQCDDGNVTNGDGCNADCTLPFCGNEIKDPDEECDDGNNVDGDGCNDCKLPFCGNEIKDPGEECDDGNNLDDDGCSSGCALESIPVSEQPPGIHSSLSTSDGEIRDDNLADFVCEKILENGRQVRDVKIMVNSCYGGGLLEDFQRIFGPGGECEGVKWVGGSASRADQTAKGYADEDVTRPIWLDRNLGSMWTSALAGPASSHKDADPGAIRDRTSDNVLEDLRRARLKDYTGPSDRALEDPAIATGNGGADIIWNQPGAKHEAVVFGGDQTDQRHHNNIANVKAALASVWQGSTFNIQDLDGGTEQDLLDAIATAAGRLDEDTQLVLYLDDHGGIDFDVDEFQGWLEPLTIPDACVPVCQGDGNAGTPCTEAKECDSGVCGNTQDGVSCSSQSECTVSGGDGRCSPYMAVDFPLDAGWVEGLEAMEEQPGDTPEPTLNMTLESTINGAEWRIELNEVEIPLPPQPLLGERKFPVNWRSIQEGSNRLSIAALGSTTAPMVLSNLEISSGPINEIEVDPCGDGFLDPDEDCDDGNIIDCDGCSDECVEEFCGDGKTCPDLEEECDDGNNINGDGCNADCTLPFCGNDIIDAGEECDGADDINCPGSCLSNCICQRPGDIDGNGDVDITDVLMILLFRGFPASGPDDPRDLDGDGWITVLDARRAVVACDNPRCAPNPP